MFASLRSRLPSLGPKPRRAVALACLVLAAVSALPAHADRRDRTVRVAVAARDLAAGHVLARGDVTVRGWPSTFVPAGAPRDPTALVGRRVAGPVGRGEAITGSRLVGRDLTRGLAAGQVASVVTVSNSAAAGLVRPGDRVDVLAALLDPSGQSGEAASVADAVRVLAVLGTDDSAAAPGTATATSADLIVATDRAVALRLARASSSHVFTVFLSSP